MDWKKIKAEYVAGGTSYRKLCEKYGVSRTTLQRKAKEEKWCELRSQAEAKTAAKIVESVSDNSAETDKAFMRLVNKLYKKAEEVIDTMPKWSVYALKEMSVTMKNLKDIKGLKSADDIKEQRARIAKMQKEIEAEKEDSEGIEVVFDARPEEWNE